MPYNVTSFNKTSPAGYLDSINTAADGLPFFVFNLAFGFMILMVLQRSGNSFDDALLAAGFATAIVSFLFFATGITPVTHVFAPISLTTTALLAKAFT